MNIIDILKELFRISHIKTLFKCMKNLKVFTVTCFIAFQLNLFLGCVFMRLCEYLFYVEVGFTAGTSVVILKDSDITLSGVWAITYMLFEYMSPFLLLLLETLVFYHGFMNMLSKVNKVVAAMDYLYLAILTVYGNICIVGGYSYDLVRIDIRNNVILNFGFIIFIIVSLVTEKNKICDTITESSS